MSKARYQAFSGWTSEPFNGEYININQEGRRHTGIESQYADRKTLRMFGGSVMWGFLSTDNQTPPTLTGNRLGLNAVNYAELGFNSRQSLNLLLQVLPNFQAGDPVVFYDGVNDVYTNCLKGYSANGHSQERMFQERMRNGKPTLRLAVQSQIGKIKHSIKKSNTYKLIKYWKNVNNEKRRSHSNACTSPEKARQVAEFVVNSWQAAEALLRRKGHPFICGLQATPYTLHKKGHYWKQPYPEMTRQVYPLIRSLVRKNKLQCFVDFAERLQEDHFVDVCCHLNNQGNQMLANEFSNAIHEKFSRTHKLEPRE